MGEGYSSSLRWLKWGQIVLSALTTAGAIGVIFDKTSLYFTYGTALLAILTLILNSYAKDLNPGQEAQKHREAASDVWNVREAYLSLLTDVRDPALSLEKLRIRRDELQGQLYKIYRAAPHTNGTAYGKAQDALKKNEELTFSEQEIDAMLPIALRRGKSRS